MDDKIFDLIYENDAVEGIAVFNNSGEVIENQLSMTNDSLQIVANTLININSGLSSAGRHLKGFILKSESITLQVCVFETVVLLLELAEPFAANKIDKNVRSILAGVSVGGGVKQKPQAQTATQVEEVTTKAMATDTSNLADQIDLNKFRDSLMKILKRVAPGGIADKMINEVISEENIASTITFLDKDRAISIGEKVVARIPNASRRKMIMKEYQVLVKSFD